MFIPIYILDLYRDYFTISGGVYKRYILAYTLEDIYMEFVGCKFAYMTLIDDLE